MAEIAPEITIVHSDIESSPHSLIGRARSLFGSLRSSKHKTSGANTPPSGRVVLPASSQPDLSVRLMSPATPNLRRRSLQSPRETGSQESPSSGLGRSSSLSKIKPHPLSGPSSSPDSASAPPADVPSQPVGSGNGFSPDISSER